LGSHRDDARRGRIQGRARILGAPARRSRPCSCADDGHPPIEKLKSVVLADGRDLRVVGKGHYELPDGSLKLESHDPEAI
jgi:hypothetical protein